MNTYRKALMSGAAVTERSVPPDTASLDAAVEQCRRPGGAGQMKEMMRRRDEIKRGLLPSDWLLMR